MTNKIKHELDRQLARYAEMKAVDSDFAGYCTEVETVLVAMDYTAKEAAGSVAGSINKVRCLFDAGTPASSAAEACRGDDNAICF